MKEKIIKILTELRPEFDFTDESTFFDKVETLILSLIHI